MEFDYDEKKHGQILTLSMKFISRVVHPTMLFSAKTKQKEKNVEMEMDSQTIIMNKNSLYLLKKEMIHCLKIGIVFLENEFESHVWDDDFSKNVLIGFGSHRNEFKNDPIETSNLLVMRCPKNCSNDDRQWICINCGQFYKNHKFDVICDCGTTNVTNLKFECFHLNHPKTFSMWEKSENVSSSFSPETGQVMEETLTAIKKQLKKHAEFGDANISTETDSNVDKNSIYSRSSLLVNTSTETDPNTIPALFFDKHSIYFLKPETIHLLKMPIILLNDVKKPYVWDNNFKNKMLLGFVSHQNQPITEMIEAVEMFVMRCPQKCSTNSRQWICTTCGIFLKAKNYEVVCNCGVANITDLNFECFETAHSKNFTIWQTELSPTLESTFEFDVEKKMMLDTIKQQLEKIAKKNEMSADDELVKIIQCIGNYDTSIVDGLKSIETEQLDGDTTVLIENFLNSLI